MDSAYPDKVIICLQTRHKVWDKTVRELCKLLGYESQDNFFAAYGYSREIQKGGRQKTVNPHEYIQELQRRYPNGSSYTSLQELFAENPDLASKGKTLMNTSTEVFGTTLTKYLRTLGILSIPSSVKERGKTDFDS